MKKRIIIALTCHIIGMVLLYPSIGWMGIMGIMIVLTGNNIEQSGNYEPKKQQLLKEKEHEHK